MASKPFFLLGAQWHSGRVLDSRPRGRGFEPHRRHCVVILEQDTFIPALVLVQPRKTRPCLTERFLTGLKESKTNKQIFRFDEYNILVHRNNNGFVKVFRDFLL